MLDMLAMVSHGRRKSDGCLSISQEACFLGNGRNLEGSRCSDAGKQLLMLLQLFSSKSGDEGIWDPQSRTC